MRCLLLPFLPSARSSSRVGQLRSSRSAAAAAAGLTSGDLSVVAHSLWSDIVKKGDTVVDATSGRGHDALFLARLALAPGAGRLLALDLQHAAVLSTQKLLAAELSEEQVRRTEVLQACHSTLATLLPPASARLIAFNLGYLPGDSDKQVVTQPATTRSALEAACSICMPGGLVSVMCYPGHAGGEEEAQTVEEFARSLPARGWTASRHSLLNRAASCPFLICLARHRID